MSSKFVSFRYVLPNQIFEIHEREWIKCAEAVRFQDIEYNAYEHRDSFEAGQHVLIDVRFFDEATLVKLDSGRPLFKKQIVVKQARSNDN